ncbi:MAG: 50S ribosomal protein L6 [Gammaproteobacteria bacterium]|nr:50S ribosomal protein L6 [Gammaproteobacteria bacterium]
MSTPSISTSRVGRKPVAIPSGVEVKVTGQELAIKGPKGKFEVAIHPMVQVLVEGGVVNVKSNAEGGYSRSGSGSKLRRSIVGTTRAKIANMVHGVAHSFERKLLLVGVGYRAQAKGNVLNLTLGFSHPIDFKIPEGITIETPSQTEVLVKGNDKDLVGLVASKIRAYRGPEPYKGKGVRYADEVIVRKETKKK